MELKEWYKIGRHRVDVYTGTFSTERYLNSLPMGKQLNRLVQAGSNMLYVFASGSGALSFGDADKFRREAEKSKDPDEFVENRIKRVRDSLAERFRMDLNL